MVFTRRQLTEHQRRLLKTIHWSSKTIHKFIDNSHHNLLRPTFANRMRSGSTGSKDPRSSALTSQRRQSFVPSPRQSEAIQTPYYGWMSSNGPAGSTQPASASADKLPVPPALPPSMASTSSHLAPPTPSSVNTMLSVSPEGGTSAFAGAGTPDSLKMLDHNDNQNQASGTLLAVPSTAAHNDRQPASTSANTNGSSAKTTTPTTGYSRSNSTSKRPPFLHIPAVLSFYHGGISPTPSFTPSATIESDGAGGDARSVWSENPIDAILEPYLLEDVPDPDREDHFGMATMESSIAFTSGSLGTSYNDGFAGEPFAGGWVWASEPGQGVGPSSSSRRGSAALAAVAGHSGHSGSSFLSRKRTAKSSMKSKKSWKGGKGGGTLPSPSPPNSEKGSVWIAAAGTTQRVPAAIMVSDADCENGDGNPSGVQNQRNQQVDEAGGEGGERVTAPGGVLRMDSHNSSYTKHSPMRQSVTFESGSPILGGSHLKRQDTVNTNVSFVTAFTDHSNTSTKPNTPTTTGAGNNTNNHLAAPEPASVSRSGSFRSFRSALGISNVIDGLRRSISRGGGSDRDPRRQSLPTHPDFVSPAFRSIPRWWKVKGRTVALWCIAITSLTSVANIGYNVVQLLVKM
ncbi:hypothetical protein HK102_007407 [Quaeritorhiza haematococci]|nr:hypothetical protein HK102_007407 [Quaeritorhiza haematococci]